MNRLLLLRRAMMSAGAALVKLIVTGASGIVSFVTNVAKPMSVTCEFSPVQAEGTPSPINVLPISGWTGVDIEQTGVNIWDEILVVGTIGTSGEDEVASDNLRSDYIDVSNFDSVYIKHPQASKGIYRIYEYDDNKTIPCLRYVDGNSTGVFIVPSDCKYIRFRTYRAYGKSYKHDISINYPSTDIEYHAYHGNSLPLTWQDTAGTVYGGSITLNEDGSADFTGTCETYTVSGSSVRNASYTYTNVKYAEFQKPSRSSLNGISNSTKICLCSIGTIHRTAGGFDNAARINQLVISAQSQWFWFGFAPGTTLEEMQETLDGAVICYGLKPEYRPTYHFDNIGQLQSFLGTNTVWHDMNGSIEVEYYNKQ